MNETVLVVDDIVRNARMLAQVLSAQGYAVQICASGAAALEQIAAMAPDLVLLDVMMPGMDGYEVCRRLRADPATAALPVVLVTALDAREKIRGLEAGADDFLTKPIELPELLARVRSLLRIKTLYDEVQAQRRELLQWSKTLEARVAEGVREVEQLSRLKRFFSAPVAQLILDGELDDPLRSRRVDITVLCIDLRGYTAFSETAPPEDVIAMLREYHACMGELIMRYQGTVERFAGDMIMVFFNDPIPLPNAPDHAVRMALDMQSDFRGIQERWRSRGYDLDIGIGIARGYATIGAIGFEGRSDYGAVGPVCNLAARLCDHAAGAQTLVSDEVRSSIEGAIESEALGGVAMKGFHEPVAVFRVSPRR